MTERSRKPARTSGTVLIVDPDSAARASARGFLESHGYRVLDAGDPPSAERIARLYVGPIHVLLIELHLTDTSGPALADRLKSLHPEQRVLFVSARAHSDLVSERDLAAHDAFLHKPVTAHELATKVRSVMGATGRYSTRDPRAHSGKLLAPPVNGATNSER